MIIDDRSSYYDSDRESDFYDTTKKIASKDYRIPHCINDHVFGEDRYEQNNILWNELCDDRGTP